MSTTTTDALNAAVAAMNQGRVFDVTIVCTTDDHQAAYWMDRLAAGVCRRPDQSATSASNPYPMVLAVSEDWNAPGGAGNGLGTLYAFEKANALAQQHYSVNLAGALAAGEISAALYHTAGKGTRLAPLPASENNNKPGVVRAENVDDRLATFPANLIFLILVVARNSYPQKLPFGLQLSDGSYQPLTVLEAVVKQTGIYAKARKGRLSVYWGDQVFLPSQPFDSAPTHHIDIMCTLLGDQAPTAEEWTAQGLEKYGVIACIQTAENRVDAAQVEKVSHATATAMLDKLGKIRQVGPSLGSFSVSAMILQALCAEFTPELAEKTGKLDTDPHFWMPLTLSSEDYLALMEQKGTDNVTAKAHYDRMAAMKDKLDLGDKMGLFGAVDVGKDACWWDYGLVKLYSKNTLVLLEDSPSATLLKKFLGLAPDAHVIDSTVREEVALDANSFVFGSKVAAGSIQNSLLASSQAAEITADGAIIVNCVARKITAGPGAILYNIMDQSEAGIVAGAGDIQVAVTDETGHAKILKSRMDVDGGQAWKIQLPQNDVTFEQVHQQNQNANIQVIQALRQAKFEEIAQTLEF
jgi:hypothetical protein